MSLFSLTNPRRWRVKTNSSRKIRKPSTQNARHFFSPQGEAAKNQVGQNPANTIYDVKRLIGRSITESMVKKDIKSFPYTVKDKGGKPSIHIKHKVASIAATPQTSLGSTPT